MSSIKETTARSVYGKYAEGNTIADLCRGIVRGRAESGEIVTHIYSYRSVYDGETNLAYFNSSNHENLLDGSNPHITDVRLVWSSRG